jgi:hypothetical protein
VPPPGGNASLLFQFYNKLNQQGGPTPRNREDERIKREIAKLKEDRMNRIKYTIVDKVVKEGIPREDLSKVLSQRHK